MSILGGILSDVFDVLPVSWLCNLFWGPAATFGVDGQLIVKTDVRTLLAKYGIKSWGYFRDSQSLTSAVIAAVGAFLKATIEKSTPPDGDEHDNDEDVESSYSQSSHELLFNVPTKKARWTLWVLQMNKYPVTRIPLAALEKKRAKKWRL